MKKRIIIFSLAYFPRHVGGAEVAIKEKTDRMPEYEFHMVTNRFDSTLPREERIGNVVVHRIGITRRHPSMVDLRRWPLHINKYLFQFLAAWTAWRLHRRYRFDAAWAMMAHSGGIPAYLFTRLVPTVPLVLELQEGDAPSYIERIMRPVWPLFTRVFTRADAVSVISTFLGRWAVQRGFPGTPVLVPNGVDVANFARVYPDAVLDTMRDALGKRMGDVFLVTTSRLVRKNACDDVIRALAMLPEHLSFVILGNGPEEVALKKLASSLDVVERVWFVGHIGHTDMPKYLKACDIFVRPSRSEGMGASFVEAMAAGLPVIATQEGGIADFLFDEKRNPDKPITGWAVEKDSPEDIARAVRDIMDKPEKVRAVVRTAKEMVIEQYDWDVVTKTMREQVFEPLFR
jgi:glycosyltransferase involved in cell wall biosynthesis